MVLITPDTTNATSRRGMRRVLIWMAVVVAAFSLPLAERALFRPEAAVAICVPMPEQQKQAIAIATDTTKLFIGWAVALIGLHGLLLRRHFETDKPMTISARISIVVGAVAATLSVFFGQLGLSASAVLLSNNVFPVTNLGVIWPGKLQFGALLASLACVSGYIIESAFGPPVSPVYRK
jgi:hypothetical protein